MVLHRSLERVVGFTGAQVLGHGQGDGYECLCVLSLTCGLRMDEALGLPWQDIALPQKVLETYRKRQRFPGLAALGSDEKGDVAARLAAVRVRHGQARFGKPGSGCSTWPHVIEYLNRDPQLGTLRT